MAPAPPLAPARPFFGRVESLRGLGAMAVAAYHFSGCALNGVPLLPPVRWEGVDSLQNAVRAVAIALLPAHAAVMVFFVISGFVLRLSLEHGPQRPVAATTRFFLSRIFRAFPIVIAGVAIMAFLANAGTVTTWQVATNMLLLDVSMIGALWALQVELLMAPVIVVLYYLERRRGPRALLVVAIVTTALAYKPSWAGWSPLSTNLFTFVLGMLIPTMGRQFVNGLTRRGAGVWLAVSLVVLVLPNVCFGRYSRNSAVVEAYAAVMLVSLIAYRQDVVALKCLDAKPLRWLGLSSVSYYVLHMATVPVVLLVIAPAVVPAAWSVAAPAAVGLGVLAVWLIALGPLTLATYYLIEAPGIALGRRVTRLLGLGKPEVLPAPPIPREEAPRMAA